MNRYEGRYTRLSAQVRTRHVTSPLTYRRMSDLAVKQERSSKNGRTRAADLTKETAFSPSGNVETMTRVGIERGTENKRRLYR